MMFHDVCRFHIPQGISPKESVNPGCQNQGGCFRETAVSFARILIFYGIFLGFDSLESLEIWFWLILILDHVQQLCCIWETCDNLIFMPLFFCPAMMSDMSNLCMTSEWFQKLNDLQDRGQKCKGPNSLYRQILGLALQQVERHGCNFEKKGWFLCILNGFGCFWWLAHAISLKNAVSRAQNSAESLNIGVLGVVPGEPWGDGEAYAVARASRDSNSLEKDEWFWLLLVVGPCYFSKKCGLLRPKQALKVKIFMFWGLSLGNLEGMEKSMLWPEPVEIPIL